MAGYVIDAAMDAELDYLKNNITERYICTGTPTTRAEAITNALATMTGLSASNFAALANGDTSGRKMHVASQSGLSVSVTGTAAHVALTGSTGSTLLIVTTCTTQALTTGNTVNVPAFDQEILDAA